MKLVVYEMNGVVALGVVCGDRVAELRELAIRAGRCEELDRLCCLGAFLDTGPDAVLLVQALVAEVVQDRAAQDWPALAAVRLLAPVPPRRKILALAGNYHEHIREGGGTQVPKETMVPQVFVKPNTCLIGPEEDIRLPGSICTSVDYEGELGVMIGQRCRNVSVEEALEQVAGYLIVNDVSGRELNIAATRQETARSAFFDWLNGKWFDTFAPMGPYLVLKDEVPDPQDLELTTKVNGELRQRASTGDMIFSVAESVSWVSQFVTLEPGDVIATGTPAGVGATTGTYLQPDDLVEVEITGLGVLRNRVASADGSSLAQRAVGRRGVPRDA